ncbi:MAG: DUF1385 domain-containing protein [Candidatus Eisenbacteria bacterium]|uniref:DUF1385 domain-containing protein n=1 Tax=Eiseniibacteriota bacterium TaxID=2212470 RepID=A0A7Y2E746_UNCEI|nr:DUF1385 domain-containing protein [Candidatus Eisenbacteria bacterium]
MSFKKRFLLIQQVMLSRYAPVGGQAVIEGVMMRSPRMVATAVQSSDGEIELKVDPFVSITKKFKVLGLPILRGVVGMVETLALGMRCLNYSADIAAKEEDIKEGKDPEESKGMNSWAMGLTMFFSFAMGLGLFFYLPLKITEWTGVQGTIGFNLVDGAIRLTIFLLYLYLVSLWGEMRRLFQYHGAEHKVIHTFEAGLDINAENAKPFTTLHPRCGTSFLFSIMILSIGVFMFFGHPETLGDRLLRFAGVPLIAGLGFEFIRFSGKHADNKIVHFLSIPGLWLQRVTTKEPDMAQLAVACSALNSVLPLTEEDEDDVRMM